MRVSMSEIFDDDESVYESQRQPEHFLTKDVPESKIEVRVVSLNDVPEPFRYSHAREIKNLAIKYTPESMETFDILIEDAVVEYKDYANQKREMYFNNQNVAITYLQSYVSVGIPTDRYNWLLKKLSEATGRTIHSISNAESKEYCWVSAQLPQNSDICENVSCCVYNKKLDDTVPIGNISEVLTGLKSSIIGFGQFNVRSMMNLQGHYVMSLLLTGFQMKDLTKKQSCPKPFVASPPSVALLESLKNLKLIEE